MELCNFLHNLVIIQITGEDEEPKGIIELREI
jgi:hypothetical protein